MLTFSTKHKIKNYSTKAFNMYFRNSKIATFDIETTGLSAGRDSLILSGILEISSDSAITSQFFSEGPSDEVEVLEKTVAALCRNDVIVTYNGRSFDLPFLRKRIEIKCPELLKKLDQANIFNLDLYNVIRNYSDIPSQTISLTQKSLEHYFGLSDSRIDSISGKESVELYERYLSSGNSGLIGTITRHNFDDILQLQKLIPILSKCDLHRAIYKSGIPARPAVICTPQVKTEGLTVTVNSPLAKNYISFPSKEKPFSINSSAKDKSAELFFPCQRLSKTILIIDALKTLGFTNLDDLCKACPTLSLYPAYSSGYLVLKHENKISHLEINTFIIEFIKLNSHLFLGK